jgi:hypothetical protein
MTRTVWIGSVAALVMASVLLADQAVVRTRDGATFEGEFTDHPDAVTVTIHGIETVIPKSDIVSVDHIGNIDQDLLTKLQSLELKDVNGRLLLAREAFARNRYPLARDILISALAVDPNSRDASDLLEVVNSHIRMERAKAESAANPTPAPATQPAPVQPFSDRRLLTPADIEAVRRGELKPTDTSVRLRFESDVKKRFADSQNIPFPDFNVLPPLAQATSILDKGDPSLKGLVRIMTDPEAILVYRRQVQPLIIQGCATTGCHGASPGGGFMLFTTPDNDLTTYTNFYILQSYKREGAQPTGVFTRPLEHRLISRGRGDTSLLANYGLPPALSDFDHPPVRGRAIQPIFRNREDLRYRMLVDWMDNTLTPFEPDYGIVYTPPMPTTQPASAGG